MEAPRSLPQCCRCCNCVLCALSAVAPAGRQPEPWAPGWTPPLPAWPQHAPGLPTFRVYQVPTCVRTTQYVYLSCRRSGQPEECCTFIRAHRRSFTETSSRPTYLLIMPGAARCTPSSAAVRWPAPACLPVFRCTDTAMTRTRLRHPTAHSPPHPVKLSLSRHESVPCPA